ncbi:hypothetical protein FCM35_KLT21379 [Carex littledalei]|uniref:Uncharacterized protein n=1 Tax=Carex littledalei TaxID=544730 RepID=A0A833QUP1_9POAL|nr:hypothetical protein FCM35_KLT21379 [Carex littledalei]
MLWDKEKAKPSDFLLLLTRQDDKENIPPDPGSGSKTTPIKEGATVQSLAASGGVSDSNRISYTVSAFEL